MMGEVQAAFTLLCLAIVILLVVMSVCRFIGLWTWSTTWIFSTKEEKIGLTKSKGYYNANGYLIPSDSLGDINLCYSGSFKRFDPVDHDLKLVSSFQIDSSQSADSKEKVVSSYPHSISAPFGTVCNNDIAEFTRLTSTSSSASIPSLGPTLSTHHSSPNIPPQPLRPAPAPPPRQPQKINSLDEMKKEVGRMLDSEILAQPTNPTTPLRRPPPVPPRSNISRSGTSEEVPRPVVKSQSIIETEEQVIPVGLHRAMSCDSMSSDSSVALGDLDEPHVTGYLCVGLDYDSECADLSVSVLEAKDLVGTETDSQNVLLDTFVRVYLLPDKVTSLQTRVYRKSNSPSYKEKFLFGLEPVEFNKRSLTFYVYQCERDTNTLIGEGELRLSDISTKQGVTTWVTLTDTGQVRTEWGELMLSLSYLPTAERLTVVVVKARNLVYLNSRDSGEPFVKVYLLKNGKKIHKKKTSTKRSDRSPIFNEAMIFSVPAQSLHSIQLRLTVSEIRGEPKATALGHVILGSQATGKSLSHWTQMLSSLRKPIAMWHCLRK